jgi:uncharacterized protein (DUF362 family)
MPLNRRDFLRTSAVLAGSVILPKVARSQEAVAQKIVDSSATPDVVHVTGGSAEQAVAAALEPLGGIGAYVSEGQTVAITPNVGFPNPPEMATTTDPDVVRAVIKLCREAGAARVLVVDYPVRNPQLCFERSLIDRVADGFDGVQIVPLSSGSAWTEVDIPGGVSMTSMEIATAARNADVLINVPIAKCHGGAGVSFSMKNMMGLVKDRRFMHRNDIHQCIVDMCRVLNADLVIIDALRALVTGGPGGPGRVEHPGAILAGTNQTTIDAYAVTIAEWYNRRSVGREIAHIKLANDAGMGVIELSEMNVQRIEL